MLSPFHLAFPVENLETTENFYVDLLACEIGRKSETWIDFNLYGHQITAHLRGESELGVIHNAVDGDQVPVPHFGVVLPVNEWQVLAERLEENNVDFKIKPRTRFKGEAGEQSTLFIADPSGNYLEFKAFKDNKQLFAK